MISVQPSNKQRRYLTGEGREAIARPELQRPAPAILISVQISNERRRRRQQQEQHGQGGDLAVVGRVIVWRRAITSSQQHSRCGKRRALLSPSLLAPSVQNAPAASGEQRYSHRLPSARKDALLRSLRIERSSRAYNSCGRVSHVERSV